MNPKGPQIELDDTDDLTHLLRLIVPEVLSDRLRLAKGAADLVADEVCSRLQRRAGGREVYLPAPSRRARDVRMQAAFDARRSQHPIMENLEITSREFNVSTSTVRRVCCS